MNRILNFQWAVLGGLVLALIIGIIFQSHTTFSPANPTIVQQTDQPTTINTSQVTLPPTPINFVTLPNTWLIRLKLYRESAPVIEKVTRMPQGGRVSIFSGGDSTIQILSFDGEVIYELKFTPSFTVGEPQRLVDEITMLIVLPDFENASAIRVITSQGEVTYELQSSE